MWHYSYVSSSNAVVCRTFSLRLWNRLRKIKITCVSCIIDIVSEPQRQALLLYRCTLHWAPSGRLNTTCIYRWLTCIGVISESWTIYSEGILTSRTPEFCTQPSCAATVGACLRLRSSVEDWSGSGRLQLDDYTAYVGMHADPATNRSHFLSKNYIDIMIVCAER